MSEYIKLNEQIDRFNSLVNHNSDVDIYRNQLERFHNQIGFLELIYMRIRMPYYPTSLKSAKTTCASVRKLSNVNYEIHPICLPILIDEISYNISLTANFFLDHCNDEELKAEILNADINLQTVIPNLSSCLKADVKSAYDKILAIDISKTSQELTETDFFANSLKDYQNDFIGKKIVETHGLLRECQSIVDLFKGVSVCVTPDIATRNIWKVTAVYENFKDMACVQDRLLVIIKHIHHIMNPIGICRIHRNIIPTNEVTEYFKKSNDIINYINRDILQISAYFENQIQNGLLSAIKYINSMDLHTLIVSFVPRLKQALSCEDPTDTDVDNLTKLRLADAAC